MIELCLSEGFMKVCTVFILMQYKGQNETRVKLTTVTYWIKDIVGVQAHNYGM